MKTFENSGIQTYAAHKNPKNQRKIEKHKIKKEGFYLNMANYLNSGDDSTTNTKLYRR